MGVRVRGSHLAADHSFGHVASEEQIRNELDRFQRGQHLRLGGRGLGLRVGTGIGMVVGAGVKLRLGS